MIRAFVAVSLPEEAREALEDVQLGLQVGRLTAPQTFHITLAYLDKQSERTLEHVHEVLSQIRLPSFQLRISGLGLFGGRHPKVLWADIAPSDALDALREKTRRAAMRSGVELSRERFRPHVTLARFKPRLRPGEIGKIEGFLAEFGGLQGPVFDVTEFVLYRSTLHPAGAQHDPMVRYPLDPGPRAAR